MGKVFPAFKPYLDKRAVDAVAQCVLNGEISGNFGSELVRLERTYSDLHDNYHAVSCSSGTAALHLACLGLGLRPNDTVVVPATTNMASFFAPMYEGASIICCDVDPLSGLISLTELEEICKRTRVDFVIAVHLYGHVVSATDLSRLAKRYRFRVIEDCAEAHFASNDDGKYVGCSFEAGCFSFYANKIIAAGEGGIALFKNKVEADIAKNRKNLAFSSGDSISKFYHQDIGYNYRMTNLSAALINVALDDRDSILQRRGEICDWYENELAGCGFIDFLFNRLASYRVNWVYCVKFKDQYVNGFGDKNGLLRKLMELGVEARDFFYPADHQPFFLEYMKERGQYSAERTRHSMEFYKGSIYLPVYLEMTREDVKSICQVLRDLEYQE